MGEVRAREVRLLLDAAKVACGNDPGRWAEFIEGLSPAAREALQLHWALNGRRAQLAPGGKWRLWLMQAGRGFGKTRAGSEWVHAVARMAGNDVRIALVAASREEAVRVMVEGESGLLATAGAGWTPQWRPSKGELSWKTGAVATLYSAAAPEALRGPQHHAAWCDELGKWGPGGVRAWDNLLMGLRLGEWPRALVTTTPRGGSALLKRVVGEPGLIVSGGSTFDNPHLPEAFVQAMTTLYGDSRLGRQELAGELLGEVEGSLFPPALLERQRLAGEPGELARIVIGVDPPASGGGTCGIVVAAADSAGRIMVLEDASVAGQSPEGWARRVAAAALFHGADRVVAEANMGGDMVRSVLEQAAPHLPLQLVHASRAKVARAEPVSVAFEGGRVWLAGRFPELEEELERLVPGEVPSPSPDRADACVWAVTALLGRGGEPRMRSL